MKKFWDAWHGLAAGWRDNGVRLQIILAVLTVIAGFLLSLKEEEWLAVLLCIGLVVSLEMVNSCLEQLCNCITTKIDPRIRRIKDMAAGAVLVSAIISLLVAAVILAHHIV